MSKYYTTTDIDSNLRIDIDFEVQDDVWGNLSELALKVSKAVFSKLDIYKYITHIEFSIVLTNNDTIQKINFQYIGKDKSTNVLSFPAQDIIIDKLGDLKIQDGFLSIGDIIFAYGVMEDEIRRDGNTFQNHFAHLLVHGLLHLLGYDHEEDQDAFQMESLEVEILSSLGIKSPYEY